MPLTPVPAPVDREVAQDDRSFAAGVDDDAVRAGGEDAAGHAVAVDGDRLGDRDGAEAARIEDVDLAAGCGLRDRAGERLAGRRAAARVDVVADAGDPGAGRLRVGGPDAKYRYRCSGENAKQRLSHHGHGSISSFVPGVGHRPGLRGQAGVRTGSGFICAYFRANRLQSSIVSLQESIARFQIFVIPDNSHKYYG